MGADSLRPLCAQSSMKWATSGCGNETTAAAPLGRMTLIERRRGAAGGAISATAGSAFRAGKKRGVLCGHARLHGKNPEPRRLALLGKPAKTLMGERIFLEAQRFLTYGNDAVNQIGYRLGFGEPTNFVKFFKKQTALTPQQFRERERSV